MLARNLGNFESNLCQALNSRDHTIEEVRSTEGVTEVWWN